MSRALSGGSVMADMIELRKVIADVRERTEGVYIAADEHSGGDHHRRWDAIRKGEACWLNTCATPAGASINGDPYQHNPDVRHRVQRQLELWLRFGTGLSRPNARWMRHERLAAIQIKRRQLGLEDEDWRDIVERVTGQRTTKGLNPKQTRCLRNWTAWPAERPAARAGCCQVRSSRKSGHSGLAHGTLGCEWPPARRSAADRLSCGSKPASIT